MDTDTEYESCQPPAFLLSQLKPPAALSVADFIQLPAPRRPGSRKITLPCEEWFSDRPPTSEMTCVDELLLPDASLCTSLDSELAVAIRNHALSVQHPTKEGVYLPLWTVRAWKWGDLMDKRQRFWKTCLEWIEKASVKEDWDQDTYDGAKRAVLRCVR